eukprot:2864280-Prorocentrum_lima.AAC.1
MVCALCGTSPIHHVWTRPVHRDFAQGFCRQCWNQNIEPTPHQYAARHLDLSAAADACPLCGCGEGGSEHL